MPIIRTGVVSVVLVNFRGADDTIEALEHLRQVDWPAERLEVIVVENGSADGSAARIREAAPWAIVVESSENRGFAGGCNFGVNASSGEFVAFLNSDAKPDSQWIRAAIDTFGEDSRIGAVASKVLDWDGDLVDYIDAGLTWFGMGYKPLVGWPAHGEGTDAKDVLFGTGSAMFVRRSVFDEISGFDERFFMFFEDVDLGWRLNLRGWRYRFSPASIAFHKHHGSVSKFGSFKETYFLERNALFAMYKNLGQEQLDKALPAALLLAARRAVSRGGLESSEFDFRNPGGDAEGAASIGKDSLAGLFALDQFVEHLASLTASRDEIQGSRVRSDASMLPLFRKTDAPSFSGPGFLEGYESLIHAFGVLDAPRATRILILTGDPLGVKLAGPAIRAWNMALALSSEHDVTLVTLSTLEELDAPFTLKKLRPGDNRNFETLERWADIIVFQGHAMAIFDALQHTDKIVVVDIYDPMHLEQLEQGRELPPATWQKQVADATAVLNEQMTKGDFFLCASERQRHFYLGQLAALGRINPATYASDPDLESLIAVAPFGLSSTPPEHVVSVLKGVRPGIGADDKVLLWAGGLYNWFDPKTLIKAVADLSGRRPNVRLFFQGTKHPHPGVPEMEIVSQSRELARSLGALDHSVFFNESWVEYSVRQNFLLEADAGVSTHFSHVETTFSFRTRILDYLWAELPMVVTEGDSFAELIAAEGLGIVVPATDTDALSVALERILFDEEFIAEAVSNIRRVRERFFWERTLSPLVDFARNPSHAADRRALEVPKTSLMRASGRAPMRRKPYGIRHDVELALHHLRHSGPRAVATKIVNRLKRRA
ncbi:glycosyltransferase [Cryobacterium sp. TMT1-21]|uniref:Glycosyltransferase n=1 Tax=Cryobacterium shii TaxID=1259235 RepID=A0AAQ2C5E7_9MICO|nr:MULTISPECIES: glycosyltransferase [Cryobacterium]TFC44945.1 glycosyltransferase [Cryobacterium shii]TFC89624.1 glycosyltransferase [Cryobacterium sp. TmT2-59]TFD16869.1 glycosyltransferase [Cryobacterium sp. TMT1-21]